ncbi:hypothetical protein DACRYDRAFT_108774 [Dacryopinax primogenitus]|uniref:SH3 domain-containing protein n=1 Tax=Dacryopinax primogenitus (strain DJM 731) TaxID=1858805 RepID=M5G4G6_DACPD|nr:uncharacterized protein DACRYDRAFT_108774 [Dacryopinax primogenitus]EJU00707.1 hypothetical protein DACRYDRAFT_108774 [Dacryopinax primogenitus]
MAVIHDLHANLKRKPSELALERRAIPRATAFATPDGAQVLEVRAGPSTSSSHHLAITPGASPASPAPTPNASSGTGSSSRGTPVFVPVLATVFSVLGVLLFGFLLFLLCRRRKKTTSATKVEAQKREKWGARWRQRGQDSSDAGSPPFMGYMGPASSDRTSSPSFLSPNTGAQLVNAPTSPSGWGPFHITPYRISFAVRMPLKSQPSKQKQAAIVGPKDLVLPSKPSRFYDRRSPPGGSQVSIFTRPSYRSRRTEGTPPPSYNSRGTSGRTLATLATNGSRSTSGRTPPSLPPVVTGPALNLIPPAPQSGEELSPYQPIPSAVLTPFDQVVIFPTTNLPLPRKMVVVSTFTPALSDEMSIQVGQILKLVEEYDDGWCLVERKAVNGQKAEQGAVPRFCLDEIHPDEPGTGSFSVRSMATPLSTGPTKSPRRKGSLRRRMRYSQI